MLKTDELINNVEEYIKESNFVSRVRAIFPFLLFFCMEGVVLLAGALLSPLKGTWLAAAFVGRILFALSPVGTGALPSLPPSLYPVNSAEGVQVFMSMFALLFLLYLVAIHYLPRLVSPRFILLTTLFLGCACLLLPIVSSQDIFSYTAYARIGALYHLNPLTTVPTAIRHDPIYPFVYWINQPSAYGPIWAILSCGLQWVAQVAGLKSLLSIELLLRVLGLCAHLGSTWLIWSLSAHLVTGNKRQQRLRALIAFAWNPFLLIEACVNAHNDTIMLFLVLLALWLLLPHGESVQGRYLLTAVVLALAACIKITMVLFLPGLLLYLWTRQVGAASMRKRLAAIVATAGVFAATVILLYAPFWQHGAILHLLQVSPATNEDINSPYQFAASLFSSLKGINIPSVLHSGTWVVALSHKVSMILFAIVFAAICLRSLLVPRYVNTLPALIRWIALVWLLYCIVGSPWFFPWYTITFFGLFALVEAEMQTGKRKFSFFSRFPVAGFSRLLTITMFIPIAGGTWNPGHGVFALVPGIKALYISQFVPFLPHFRWQYLNGLWIWAIPFLVLCYPPLLARLQKYLFRWRERRIAT